MAEEDRLRQPQTEQQADGELDDGPSEDPSGPESGSPDADEPPGPSQEAASSAHAGVDPEEAEGGGGTDDLGEVLTVEEELARERDELLDDLRRVQADFENFRKRIMRDQTAQLDRATEGLIEQLLPVLDSFELAVLNVPEGELDDAAAKLRKGVELVYAELLGVLEKAGLERLEALGKPFDPEEHEAVMRDDDSDDGAPHVTEVLRTGYRLKGRVLRPAMVRVGSKR